MEKFYIIELILKIINLKKTKNSSVFKSFLLVNGSILF